MGTHQQALDLIQQRAQDHPFYERLYDTEPASLDETPLLGPQQLLTAEDSPVRTGTKGNVLPRSVGPDETVAVHRSRPDIDAMEDAFGQYSPLLPGDRMTCVLMDPRQAGTDFAPFLQHHGHDHVIVDPAAPGDDAGLLREVGPATILGRPDSIAHLADSVEGLDPDTLVTAGPVTTDQQEAMEIAFGDTRLHQALGLIEAGFIGVGCTAGPLNSYHVPAGLYHPEIIDPATGTPVPDGEEGEIVITTLWDGSLALNRYRTGWRGHRLPDDHGCGQDGSRIRVTGQAPVGAVRLQTGRVHRTAIDAALERCDLSRPFRLDLDDDTARLIIDPGREYTDTESAQNALSRKLMSRTYITADHTWRQLAGSDHLPRLEVQFGAPDGTTVEDRRFPG